MGTRIIKGKDNREYTYEACEADIEVTVEPVLKFNHGFLLEEDEQEVITTMQAVCERPAGHGGPCQRTIPFNDFKVVARAHTTGLKP